MTKLFKDAEGDSPIADVFNNIKTGLQERTPLDSDDIEYDYTPNGARPKLKRKPEQQDSGGTSGEVLLVSEVAPDYLVCRSYDVDRDGVVSLGTEEILVAKSQELRRSVWDGTTLRGVSYTTVSSDGTGQTRTADGVSERVSPGYLSKYSFVPVEAVPDPVPVADIAGCLITALDIGETVLTVIRNSTLTEVTRIDINDAGRQFLPASGNVAPRQFAVVTIEGSMLGCRIYDNGEQVGSVVYVAKPPALRRAGLGTADDTQVRTVNGATERVDPTYIGGSIIYAMYVEQEMLLDRGILSHWIDVNVDARRWEFGKVNVRACKDGSTQYLAMRAQGQIGTPFPGLENV